jgi:hypothetical protein
MGKSGVRTVVSEPSICGVEALAVAGLENGVKANVDSEWEESDSMV